MRLFGRSEQPWRESVQLDRHERVLAWAQTPGGWVVATTRALWLPDRTGLTRLGWESIDNASWDRDTAALSVSQAAPLGGHARRLDVRMGDEADVLLVIKERVRATVVATRYIRLDGGRGATVVARRPPGQDALTWSVSVDRGTNLDDPAQRREIEQALGALRAELGQ